MSENSAIEWTDHTFNPWEGCAKVSEGCKNCYAETRNERWHGGQHWGVSAPRLMRSEANWAAPLKWNRDAQRLGVRARVFCASLADVFEDRPDLIEPRSRLFDLIAKTPWLDWLLLTKRPENMKEMVPSTWREAGAWPSNVWAGTTVENNEMLLERVPYLLDVPARVRFLSIEPLLEEIDLDPPYCDVCGFEFFHGFADDGTIFCNECEDEASYSAILDPCADEAQRGINWVIVGGESGPGSRPFHLEWARRIVEQCREASVPVLVKQMGDAPRLGGQPLKLSRKGKDMAEWPEDLRVREMP